jgi:hypothetical protein
LAFDAVTAVLILTPLDSLFVTNEDQRKHFTFVGSL